MSGSSSAEQSNDALSSGSQTQANGTLNAASSSPASRGEKAFVIGFILVGLLGPIILGERYPFSIAPMFCQQPTCYCEYTIFDPSGEPIELHRFQLQRVYDGNPEGMGVGIKPPATLDQFGSVPTEEQLIEHMQGIDGAWEDLPFVDVVVDVIGDLEGVRVGRIEDRSFRVRVVAPGGAE